MVFQSGAVSMSTISFNIKQMDSSASLTIAGGFAIERTSANCFFLMPLTAVCVIYHSEKEMLLFQRVKSTKISFL